MSQPLGRACALRPLRRLHAAPCARRNHAASSTPTIAALLRTPPSQLPPQPPAPPGHLLTLNAFVRSVRKQKRVAFAALGDGSSLQTVQAVLTPQQADGSVPEPQFARHC